MVLTYNLGSGVAVLSGEPLSLSQWHTVTATLVQRQATVKVDNGNVTRSVSPGPSTQLQTARQTYLGGVSQTVRLPQALPFTTGNFFIGIPRAIGWLHQSSVGMQSVSLLDTQCICDFVCIETAYCACLELWLLFECSVKEMLYHFE